MIRKQLHPYKQPSGRLEYLDIAKGIGILLVVLGHHLSGFDRLTAWIYSFHMPLFFVISGWLYSHKRPNDSMWAFATKKAKSLLYPYVVFSILILVWKYTLYFLLGSVPEEGFREIWLKTVTAYGYHALWFLPVLFFSEIIIHKIESSACSAHIDVLCYGSFAVCGLVISEFLQSGMIRGLPDYALRYIGKVCLAVMFSKIGILAERCMRCVHHKWRWLLFVGCAAISVGLFALNGLTNMSAYRIGNYPIYVILGITGSMATILLTQLIGKSSFFAFWGKNSLFVMATHMDFSIEIAYIILAQLHASDFLANESIIAIVLELSLLAIAIPFVNKYFHFLLTPNRSAR